MRTGKHIFLFLVIFCCAFTAKSQLFTTDNLMRFGYKSIDEMAAILEKSGWEQRSVEMVTDSNFVRRTWKLENKMGGADSYFIYYDFIKDTSENYIVYQFSDRATLENYRTDLKAKGYKLYKPKKKKKDPENDVNKEKEEVYYIEKKHAIVIVKELFLYGLNSFVIYPYKPNSAIAKEMLRGKLK